jgi:hypothetical protein
LAVTLRSDWEALRPERAMRNGIDGLLRDLNS